MKNINESKIIHVESTGESFKWESRIDKDGDLVSQILSVENTEANKPLINAFTPEQPSAQPKHRWIEPEREMTEQELEKILEGQKTPNDTFEDLFIDGYSIRHIKHNMSALEEMEYWSGRANAAFYKINEAIEKACPKIVVKHYMDK